MSRKLLVVITLLFSVTAVIFLKAQNMKASAQPETADAAAITYQSPNACSIDMFEPNDSCGAASTPLGPGFFSPLYLCQGESDWYRIEVPAGYTMEVETIFNHGPTSDLDLALFADDCATQLVLSDSTTDNEYLAVQAAVHSLYFVRSYGYIPTHEGSYEMRVSLSCKDCFTYQGQLKDNGMPANGHFDFRFQLWDDLAGGIEVSPPITHTLPVSNGLVTASLYFGPQTAFASRHPLFLEVHMRHAGGIGPMTPLMPRQELTAAPVAQTLLPGAVISGTADIAAALTLGNNGFLGDGLAVSSPARHGVTIESAGAIGLEVVNPGSTGIAVGGTGQDGLSVAGAGGDGVSVYNVSGNGLFVFNASGDGVLVNSAGGDGIYGRTTSANSYGGYFANIGGTTADGVGLHAAGNRDGAPDITLGGADGEIIANGGSHTSLNLASNHDVTVTLDSDNNTAFSYFAIMADGRPGFIVFDDGDTGISGDAFISETLDINGYLTVGGNAIIAGDLSVIGTVSKGGGSFRIDHPLDPENMYLYHSFVESPDMMNVYNGNVDLDENGEAWVTLSDWFEALNRDYRYQLTPIGAPGPNLYIGVPVVGNRFQIAGGEPGMMVSWQVTGIRQDPYANANRIQVEVAKPPELHGTYLHPEAWGQPPEMGERHPAPESLKWPMPARPVMEEMQ